MVQIASSLPFSTALSNPQCLSVAPACRRGATKARPSALPASIAMFFPCFRLLSNSFRCSKCPSKAAEKCCRVPCKSKETNYVNCCCILGGCVCVCVHVCIIWIWSAWSLAYAFMLFSVSFHTQRATHRQILQGSNIQNQCPISVSQDVDLE